ncbi:MAG: alpha/beta fold hydrolase [Planctomycetota bacterium]
MDLVLLPGLDGSDVLFGPLRSALPSWCRTHVVPLPADGAQDYDTLTRHVRDRWPAVGAAAVLAWSFSGPIGVRLAADPALDVRGLVLAASFVCDPLRLLRPARCLVAPWLFAAVPFAVCARVLLGRGARSDVVGLLRRALAGLASEVAARRVRALLTVDESTRFADLRIPVLYLASERDHVVPNRSARRAAALNLRVRVRTIRGGHLALATEPASAAVEIATFLAAHPST